MGFIVPGLRYLLKVCWLTKSTLVHPQNLTTKIVQALVLCILWVGSWCPLMAQMNCASFPLCASGHDVHCTGIKNWEGAILIHTLQGCTAHPVILPVAGVWVQPSSLGVSQETLPGVTSDLTLDVGQSVQGKVWPSFFKCGRSRELMYFHHVELRVSQHE